jgi:hypothetical protein
VLRLFRLKRSNWVGRFEDERPSRDKGPVNEEIQAQMEWIQVGSDRETAVVEDIRGEATRDLEELDGRVLKRLRRRLDPQSVMDGIVTHLAYGGVLQDLSRPLAVEAERIRGTIQRKGGSRDG